MKLHATSTQQYQTVTAYDDAGVEINAVRFTGSLLVLPETPPAIWPVTSFGALAPEHFAQIEATVPDVVILGTGARQQFVHPRLTAALTARRVGVECMDNKAACRTYNILMAEGRKVALALIIELPSSSTPPSSQKGADPGHA
ncbi:MAG: Mth938-like domain-containing protein [Burkholderiaceae bacterium]